MARGRIRFTAWHIKRFNRKGIRKHRGNGKYTTISYNIIEADRKRGKTSGQLTGCGWLTTNASKPQRLEEQWKMSE